MKINYETPSISMIEFIVEDIITSSPPNPDIPENESGDDLEWDGLI